VVGKGKLDGKMSLESKGANLQPFQAHCSCRSIDVSTLRIKFSSYHQH